MTLRAICGLCLGLAACGAPGPGTETPAPESDPASVEPVEPAPGVEPAGEPSPDGGSRVELSAAEIAERLAADGRLALRSIAFRTGTAELLPESHPQLAEIVRVLQDDPALRLGIEVHSDSQGGGDFNLQTTRRRAGAIREWLQDQGVDSERLDAMGFGEERPVASNNTVSGRAENRRVELVVR